MSQKRRTYLTHHGYGEIKRSRYLALNLLLAIWLVLGVYLYSTAFWPSTCQPDNIFKAYACSLRLPESREWREAGLLTWMWSTPILAALELMRRYGRAEV